jgi:hypothetical protein
MTYFSKFFAFFNNTNAKKWLMSTNENINNKNDSQNEV